MIAVAILGLPVLLGIWIAILSKWQRGMYMLIVYVPFASGIALMLRPNPFGSLFKDFLFVLPMYAVFLLLHMRDFRHARIPSPLTLMFVAFGALALLQMFNPSVISVIVGAVGIKVWLLYIPLAYLASIMIQRAEDLIVLLRTATAVALIPCSVGILQFVMSSTVGYEETMTMFYGRNAAAATQNFAAFNMGAVFFRIPSTFSFVTQYSGYALMMLAITYMHQSVEPHLGWRLFAKIMMFLVFIACLLSGARANFVFAPALLFVILFLDAKLTRMAIWLLVGPFVMVTTLQTAGLDLFTIADTTSGLVTTYGSDLVIPDLINSLVNYPLGKGVGTNTGAARNLMSAAEIAARPHPIEGFYAKAIIELGIPGLIVLLGMMGSIIVYAIGIHRTTREPMKRSCTAAITGFIIVLAVHSFKGWQIDLDPVNVWYWILVGVLFRLPDLRFDTVVEARRQAEAAKHGQAPRQPKRRRGSAPAATRYRR
tara:strand:+ start:7770 stop:9218 length:1449 start_codon:yes stop_codon:yes gene_type:complete